MAAEENKTTEEKQTEKSAFGKVVDSIVVAYEWLNGKKRRIAIISGAVATLTPEHTAAHKIAKASLYLFGGADAISASRQMLQKKDSKPDIRYRYQIKENK